MSATELVFLSYRSEDSGVFTERLYESLEFALGPGKVFFDQSRISPGAKWPSTLQKKLATAMVVIVVIGRHWLKAHDEESGQRRLDAEGDWVRLEIEEALKEKVVIPVLVENIEIPPERLLPEAIKGLNDQQAIGISTKHWNEDVARLVDALAEHGVSPERDVTQYQPKPEPSVLGVIDYFFRRIGQAASQGQVCVSGRRPVPCVGMGDLWMLVEDQMLREQPLYDAPAVSVEGQLSPYAPLVLGNPMRKRRLHLELRQGATEMVKECGFEFGELLNGLMSYSAGQMVIRPYFGQKYAFLGLYESIVRNSIPIMIGTQYYNETLAMLFRQYTALEVRVQASLKEIPNYTQEALSDFGITDRLRSVLSSETIAKFGQPNCALYVDGKGDTRIEVLSRPGAADPARYLDGDVWVANAKNNLISRFINISSRVDMLHGVNEINNELRKSSHGRGVVASFDVREAPISDTIPGLMLSSAQQESG